MILEGQSWQIKLIKTNLNEQFQEDTLGRKICTRESCHRMISSTKQIWHYNFDKAGA